MEIPQAHVYIKNNMVHLLFAKNNEDKTNKPVYQLGSSILDFAQTDLDDERETYDYQIEYAFALYEYGNIHHPEKKGKQLHATLTMDEYCPYTYFHLEFFLNCIYVAIVDQKTDLTRILEKFPEVKVMRFEDPDPIKNFVNTLKEIFLADLTRRVNRLKKEIDFIINILSIADEKSAKLTPIQRLYLLDLKRSDNKQYYTNNPFKTQFVPLLNGERVPDNISAKDISPKNLEVVEMYEINNIDDLIRFELLKMVSGGVLVKKCANCGQYFAPVGRIDTAYCNRVYKNSENQRTCAEIGSMLKYKDKIKGDPIYTAYNKVYKRNNSRVRNKIMSQSDFLSWSEESRKLRDDCYAGKISLDEYKAWLDK